MLSLCSLLLICFCNHASMQISDIYGKFYNGSSTCNGLHTIYNITPDICYQINFQEALFSVNFLNNTYGTICFFNNTNCDSQINALNFSLGTCASISNSSQSFMMFYRSNYVEWEFNASPQFYAMLVNLILFLMYSVGRPFLYSDEKKPYQANKLYREDQDESFYVYPDGNIHIIKPLVRTVTCIDLTYILLCFVPLIICGIYTTCECFSCPYGTIQCSPETVFPDQCPAYIEPNVISPIKSSSQLDFALYCGAAAFIFGIVGVLIK